MTIALGMVGADGILLAADQLLVQDDPWNEKTFDEHEGICKIRVSEKCFVACVRVGDYVTKAVADRFLEQLESKEFDSSDTTRQLEKIAHDILAQEMEKLPQPVMCNRSLLIVFYGQPNPQLWRLRISPPRIAAEYIPTITIAGAHGNRGRFFDHYYKDHMPIEKLTFLAGHIVLSAAVFDSAMIRGLDVALFRANGEHSLLTGQEKQLIREQSSALTALMHERLTPG